MTRYALVTAVVVVALGLATMYLFAADAPPPPAPAAEASADGEDALAKKKQLVPEHIKALTEAIGAKPGVTAGRVHTLTLPRTDLDVRTLEMGEIPTEAGLASTFRVFRCGCGKYYVVGEFCVVDYEVQDVIDGLRKGFFQIASVAPMLVQDEPRIQLIRFQGEGHMEQVAATLKETVQYIGENRTKRNPLPKD